MEIRSLSPAISERIKQEIKLQKLYKELLWEAFEIYFAIPLTKALKDGDRK